LGYIVAIFQPICEFTAKTFFTAKTATPALAGGARENAKKN